MYDFKSQHKHATQDPTTEKDIPTLVNIKDNRKPIYLSRQERIELLPLEKQTGQEHYHIDQQGRAIFEFKENKKPRNEDEIEFI